jgi:hypothetical protein
MSTQGAFTNCRSVSLVVLSMLSLCSAVWAQNTAFPPAPEPSLIAYTSTVIQPAHSSDSFMPQSVSAHKFWDRQNRVLFSAVAAFCAADFTVTHMNLANGGRELNPVVRPFAGSTPALAANFVGQTAGAVGLSYFFHRTGHHRLERMTPVANIAASAFAVGYGLRHR